MTKLFGTDGIRGKANTYPITPELALLVGKAVAKHFSADGSKRCRAVLGKDTRLSGYMLENAISAGLLSMGMDVLEVGPMPTPAVAHLTRSLCADCGIMITASHNPADDNGIKLFAADGFKLSGVETDHIEQLIADAALSSSHIANRMIGKAKRIEDARGRYIEFAKSSVRNHSLKGLKIVLDCANGAAYSIAPTIFRELGAEVIPFGIAPDGNNINAGCGATHIEKMCELVKLHRADVGIAVDGDADRVIFCDANGCEVNGDRIIGMVALDYLSRGKLAGNSVVVTKMSNLGFFRAMEEHGIKIVTTDVGDHNVIEAMREGHFNVGGEQSGHVIFMDYVTTGDGIITALHVLKLMKQRERSLAELADFMSVYPQKMVNLPVREKLPLETLARLQEANAACKVVLGNSGRTMIRYSGTENKLRILVEAPSETLVDEWLEKLTSAAKSELGE